MSKESKLFLKLASVHRTILFVVLAQVVYNLSVRVTLAISERTDETAILPVLLKAVVPIVIGIIIELIFFYVGMFVYKNWNKFTKNQLISRVKITTFILWVRAVASFTAVIAFLFTILFTNQSSAVYYVASLVVSFIIFGLSVTEIKYLSTLQYLVLRMDNRKQNSELGTSLHTLGAILYTLVGIALLIPFVVLIIQNIF